MIRKLCWLAIPVLVVAMAGSNAFDTHAVGGARNSTPAAASSRVGGAYTALTPTRLLDTRTSGHPIGPGGTAALTVTGGSVPSTAGAVALNVTVTDTTTASYLTVFPTGETQPLVSNLNWARGETVANLVIVPVGTGGSVTFFNDLGNTDLVVDLEGYFAPESGASTAGDYVPLTPARIKDTRAGSPLGAGGLLALQVTGEDGIPAGATGAVLNVTATDTTAASYLTVYPEGATRPFASNLNWTAGATVANRVLTALSSSGQVSFFNDLGDTDLVVDVSGYFTSGTGTPPGNASLYYGTTPTRITDTRAGGSITANSTLAVQVTGEGGIPASATAAVLNVTATDTTAASYLTVYPGGGCPLASDLNWGAGQTVPNLAVATLSGTGSITAYNDAGSADLVVDAFGYFGPALVTLLQNSATSATVADGAGYSGQLSVSNGTGTVSYSETQRDRDGQLQRDRLDGLA
ncbi:MAG: hypothetical protein ABSF27_09795 [Candidatus Dormibacteria bacterium]